MPGRYSSTPFAATNGNLVPRCPRSMSDLPSTEDRILPFAATAERFAGLIKEMRLVTVEARPDTMGWTHPD